jgi:hypothetical protein
MATDTVDERRKRDMCAVDVAVAFNGDFSGSADGPSVSHKPWRVPQRSPVR